MAKAHAPAPGSGLPDPRKYIELPYVVKGMDVSFSGLLTFIGARRGVEGGSEGGAASVRSAVARGSFACAVACAYVLCGCGGRKRSSVSSERQGGRI